MNITNIFYFLPVLFMSLNANSASRILNGDTLTLKGVSAYHVDEKILSTCKVKFTPIKGDESGNTISGLDLKVKFTDGNSSSVRYLPGQPIIRQTPLTQVRIVSKSERYEDPIPNYTTIEADDSTSNSLTVKHRISLTLDKKTKTIIGADCSTIHSYQDRKRVSTTETHQVCGVTDSTALNVYIKSKLSQNTDESKTQKLSPSANSAH